MLALDPKWKLAYAREKWDKDQFDAGVKRLEDVVCSFHTDLSSEPFLNYYKFDLYHSRIVAAAAASKDDMNTLNAPPLAQANGTSHNSIHWQQMI
jgi:hypothetical protein